MGKFAQGIYKLKNPDKYVGNGSPRYRSGWEFLCMKTFDENPAIEQWASESIKIPYKDPLTGRATIYVPDFLIVYHDKKGKNHVEVIEVKPSNHQLIEKVGKNPINQIQFIKNQAKWEAARAWCKQRGIFFRVVNENELFYNPKQRR